MSKNIQLQHCQSIIDTSSDCFLLFDLEHEKIIEVNHTTVKMLGYASEELDTLPLSELFDDLSKDKLNELFQGVLAHPDQTQEFQSVFSTKSGVKIPMDVRLNAIKDHQDSATIIVIVATDMRAFSSSMMSQLAAVNKELQDFSYSISHDLRAPLRSIDGFAEALNEEYKHVLDEVGLDYLSRVSAGAERMGRLIDDLLALSRITRSEMVKSDVNLSLLTEESIETLRLRNPNRKIVTNITPNIIGNGDPVLLGVVISNLVNNAWKFSQTNEAIEIEFGVINDNDDDNKQTIYYIKDSGVGFNMQYVDKIFNAFQRLHSTQEFEGTGIGLATVQRIIHRHGGQIWAESEVGKGATFKFTLL